jgi:hypothetical protein
VDTLVSLRNSVSVPDVKHSIGRVALSKNRLLFGICDLPATIDSRKESLSTTEE